MSSSQHFRSSPSVEQERVDASMIVEDHQYISTQVSQFVFENNQDTCTPFSPIASKKSGVDECSKNGGSNTLSSCFVSFEKQDCLELHLKWTQAFLTCGIPFNVILIDYVPMYGCTIALDGWTSCQKKPLINVMVICPKGNMFLGAIDTSLKEKSLAFLVKVYEHAILCVGGPKNVTVIVIDNASNFRSVGITIQNKYEDISRLSFINFHIRSSDQNLRIKHFRFFFATRFATAYIVLSGLLELNPALVEMIADRRWEAWLEKYSSYQVATSKCTCLIQSKKFYHNLEKIIGITKPFVELLRMVDTDKFVIGKVYWIMSEAIQKVKDFNQFSLREKTQIVSLGEKRWTQMHTHLHGTTFVLDPTFQLNGQASNKEIMANFKTTCQLLLPGTDGRDAFHQRVAYVNREGSFGDLWHIEAIQKHPPPIWWKEYGGEAVELQHIAMRVLLVAASSRSCERNRRAYDFLHSKQRNRLSVSRANDLVYVFYVDHNDGSDMEEIDDLVPVIDDDIQNEENDVL
ncbi:hypothetical protein KP509_09G080400 [Ceratopteris richardii]|uniref:DUF659 domain-containing protein n=1 Tax=Ceratopteris richardii TaxID=49495 RepID=A0A8T2U2R3_CERRI|nr:hypothetical protein KP509_09G080400 [Ceratopteris richardii]